MIEKNLQNLPTVNLSLTGYHSIEDANSQTAAAGLEIYISDDTVQQKNFFYVAQGFFADLGYILAAKCKSVSSFSLSRQVFLAQMVGAFS